MCALPVAAGPGLSESPAVGVCVCYVAAQGGGGDPDVREQEETLNSEEELLMRRKFSLLTVYRADVPNERRSVSYIVILLVICSFSVFTTSMTCLSWKRNHSSVFFHC